MKPKELAEAIKSGEPFKFPPACAFRDLRIGSSPLIALAKTIESMLPAGDDITAAVQIPVDAGQPDALALLLVLQGRLGRVNVTTPDRQTTIVKVCIAQLGSEIQFLANLTYGHQEDKKEVLLNEVSLEGIPLVAGSLQSPGDLSFSALVNLWQSVLASWKSRQP